MSKRLAEIKTPLGNKLLLRGVHGREELGRPFSYQVELLSEDDEVEASSVVGQTMSVKLALEKESQYRYIHGVVSSFTDAGRLGRYALYRAELRPWLWLLSHTSDCRIFQNESVPDILKKVFRDLGFSDLEERLTQSYKPLDYVVQYRESTLNFVTRLMERAGIYYFFEHEDSRHTLILADGAGAHKKASGYEQVPYYPPNAGHAREHDHLYQWRLQKQFRAGSFVVNSFDFKRPRADLKATSSAPRDHAKSGFELYDYPATFVESDQGEATAKLQLKAQHARYEQLQGEGTVRGVNAGHLFSLTKAKRADANREYLIVGLELALEISDYETQNGGTVRGSNYTSKLHAIDSKTDYRLPMTTPKPQIVGPQTAIVTGKQGEDIWTDEHGRVKVQFHWDRKGKSDQNSSCWVRVAQVWAGQGWGGLYIPRVGQEVIVMFMDGDPDRPLITGSVYNGDNKPPYDLPQKASQSGIKTRTVNSGNQAQANELRFDDAQGEEQLFVHAQRDYHEVVERDRHAEIKRDQCLTIAGSQSVSVQGGHEVDGVRGAKLNVTGDYKVAASQSVELGGPKSISLNCGKLSSIEIEPEKITFRVGASTVMITPAGIVMSPSASVGNRPL